MTNKFTYRHCTHFFALLVYEGSGVRGNVSTNRSEDDLLPLPVESGDTSLVVQGMDDDRLGGLNVSTSLKRFAFAFSFSYSNRA
jgi:hypothetical protein